MSMILKLWVVYVLTLIATTITTYYIPDSKVNIIIGVSMFAAAAIVIADKFIDELLGDFNGKN